MEERFKRSKLNKAQKIIVITGAESTGKSTLSKGLSEHYQVPLIQEYAREYIENLNRPYTYKDVEVIAQQQVNELQKYRETNHPYVIVDTWLFITKIWFEVVFEKIPEWLNKAISETHIDLFLVCDTNLPWVEDPVRENGGDSRLALQKRYIDEIKQSGFKFEIVSGIGNSRLQNAITILDKLH